MEFQAKAPVSRSAEGGGSDLVESGMRNNRPTTTGSLVPVDQVDKQESETIEGVATQTASLA